MQEKELMHSTEGIGGNEKISMGDVLMSIDATKFAGTETTAEDKTDVKEAGQPSVNTTKLRKQMKALKKEVEKSPALDKPVSGRKRKQQEQKANYEINKTKLGVYLP